MDDNMQGFDAFDNFDAFDLESADTSEDNNFSGDFCNTEMNGFGNQAMNGFGSTENNGDNFGGTPNNTSEMNFSSAFQDNTQQNDDYIQDKKGVSKIAIIAIGIGLVAIILVMIIATAVTKNKNKDTEQPVQQNTTQEIDNRNVDNVLSESNNTTEQNQTSDTSVKYIQDENNYKWVEITDSENVEFDTDYSDMTFTVTGIKHYARTVDTNNNLVIKSSITGSISGLSGTYVIDIPYEKGVKLAVGNNFTVHIKLGSYNGKTVIGEISY